MATPRVTIDQLPIQGVPEDTNEIIVQDSGTTKRMSLAVLKTLASTPLTDHLNDATDAHDASAISATSSGTGVDGPNVQQQLGQLAARQDMHEAMFVDIDGDTMTGDLHIVGGIDTTGDGSFGNVLIQAGLPTVSNHATPKSYVDAEIALINANLAAKLDQTQGDARYLQLAGGTVTGQTFFDDDVVFNDPVRAMEAPVAATDVANKNYVDTQVATRLNQAGADALYVNLTGDTMSGPLSVSGNLAAAGQVQAGAAAPVGASDLTRKDYVDAQVASALDQTEADARYVNTAGDTLTGPLVLAADPSAALGAATKQYTDTQVATRLTQAAGDARYLQPAAADTAYVNVAGDTMTGTLVAPTVNGASGSLIANVPSAGGLLRLQTNSNTRLSIGDVDIVASLPVTLPADPTAGLHAATKQYVDARDAMPRALLYMPNASGNWIWANDPPQIAGATQLDVRWIEQCPPNGVAGYTAGTLATQGISGNAAFNVSGNAGNATANWYTHASGTPVSRTNVRPAVANAIAACRVTWRSSDGRVQMFTKQTSSVTAMLDNTGWTQAGTDGTAAVVGTPMPDLALRLTINASDNNTQIGSQRVLAWSFATTIDGTPFALWRADLVAQAYTDQFGTRWSINSGTAEWRDVSGASLGGASNPNGSQLDTGWRDVTASLNPSLGGPIAGGKALLRRIGAMVTWTLHSLAITSDTVALTTVWNQIPVGFQTPSLRGNAIGAWMMKSNGFGIAYRVYASGVSLVVAERATSSYRAGWQAADPLIGQMHYLTDDAWPTVMPGIPG